MGGRWVCFLVTPSWYELPCASHFARVEPSCTQGSITYSVMVSLGEMVAHLPIPGGHISLASRFVDVSI